MIKQTIISRHQKAIQNMKEGMKITTWKSLPKPDLNFQEVGGLDSTVSIKSNIVISQLPSPSLVLLLVAAMKLKSF